MYIMGIILGWYIHDNAAIEVEFFPYYTYISHLDLNKSWVRIYSDPDEDIAYFTVSSDMTDFRVPVMGETIRFTTGATGTIDEMSPNGFNLLVEPGTAEHGMSGTPVFNESGEVVGYVSAAYGTNHIYCIWR